MFLLQSVSFEGGDGEVKRDAAQLRGQDKLCALDSSFETLAKFKRQTGRSVFESSTKQVRLGRAT